jgi:hypothetical protein
MCGKRFESGHDSLRQNLGKSPEISAETCIAKLASEILRSLEKDLGELDAGTIKHSVGTAVLALVLIAKLIENSAGELRGAQAVMTADQQSEVPVTSGEEIKKFWNWLNTYLQRVASTSSQTEVSKTPESRALELWNVLLRYLPLFLVFLLLHDYGKRFISDKVNSTARFSNEQKELANCILNALQQRLVDNSSDFSTNPSSQTFSDQLRELLGIWTLEGMKVVLLSFFRSQASFQTGQEFNNLRQDSNDLRQEVKSLLVRFIKNSQVNQRELLPITQVPETDLQMAARWLLIMTHPAQSFLDVAETIIDQLKQRDDLSPEDKAYITAIAVGVIAGHHTPEGNSGYPPVDVLVSVLEHCLKQLGVDSNYLQQAQVDSNYLEKARDLMLFAAAFAKIIDVMQARCFDERVYNQNATRPLPTELQFGSQGSDTGGAELQKRMDDFLSFLDNWIKQAFSDLQEVDFDNHPIVTGYRSLYGAQISPMNLDPALNSTKINYGSIINNFSLKLGILSR